MERRRPLTVLLALATAGVVALGVTSAEAEGADQVPVVQGEALTLWAGTSQAPLKLLANDSDPEGDRLQVCRFGESQPDRSLDVEPVDDRRGGRVQLSLDPAATGTYTYEYQVCDHSYLVPATVTVDVQPVGVTTVEKVPERPRMLRVTNPDQHDISFIWAPHWSDGPYGVAEIAPGGSELVRAGSSQVDWWAGFVDGDLDVSTGYGTVGGLTPSRPIQPSSTLGHVPPFLTREPAARSTAVTGVRRETGAVDPTTVAPPVTQDDELRWWAGAAARVPVLANDSDPQGQQLDVCRIDRSGRAVSAWTQLSNTGFTVQTGEDSSGTFTITYYACNEARLAPGTVTVHLRRAKPVQVSADGSGLRVANRNGQPVRVRLNRLRDHGPLRQLMVRVPAHGDRHVPVAWHRVSWSAYIGHPRGFAGYGSLHR